MIAKRKQGKGRPSTPPKQARDLAPGRILVLLPREKPSARTATPSKIPNQTPASAASGHTRREPEQEAGRQGLHCCRPGAIKQQACWSSCWRGAAVWWCSSTAPASSSARSSPRATPSPGPSGARRPVCSRAPARAFFRDLSHRQGALLVSAASSGSWPDRRIR